MEQDKKCYKCKEWLALDCFGVNNDKKDGLDYLCKNCRHAYNNTPEKKAEIKKTQKRYGQSDKGRANRRKNNKIYSLKEKGRAAQARAREKAKDTLDYMKRKRNYSRVLRAILKGDLIKLPCQVTGSTENVDAHHWDHEECNALDVFWLNRGIHTRMHTELGKQAYNKASVWAWISAQVQNEYGTYSTNFNG